MQALDLFKVLLILKNWLRLFCLFPITTNSVSNKTLFVIFHETFIYLVSQYFSSCQLVRIISVGFLILLSKNHPDWCVRCLCIFRLMVRWRGFACSPKWSGLLDENNDTSDLELEPELSEISSIGGSVDPGSSFRIFTLFLLTNLLFRFSSLAIRSVSLKTQPGTTRSWSSPREIWKKPKWTKKSQDNFKLIRFWSRVAPLLWIFYEICS